MSYEQKISWVPLRFLTAYAIRGSYSQVTVSYVTPFPLGSIIGHDLGDYKIKNIQIYTV